MAAGLLEWLEFLGVGWDLLPAASSTLMVGSQSIFQGLPEQVCILLPMKGVESESCPSLLSPQATVLQAAGSTSTPVPTGELQGASAPDGPLCFPIPQQNCSWDGPQ